jgi:hypothetical protein
MLKEAAGSFETVVTTKEITQRHNPEDNNNICIH